MCHRDWVAVGNSIEIKYENAKDKEAKHVLDRHDISGFLKFFDKEDAKLYEFEQTPKISCYLFCVCAGDYKVHEDLDPMHVPQRVFVRRSMDEFMRAEMVFGVTKTTIDLY